VEVFFWHPTVYRGVPDGQRMSADMGTYEVPNEVPVGPWSNRSQAMMLPRWPCRKIAIFEVVGIPSCRRWRVEELKERKRKDEIDLERS